MQRNDDLVDLEICNKISVWLRKSAFIDRMSVLLENENKIGVDTEESEPLKVWMKIQFNIHSPPYDIAAALLPSLNYQPRSELLSDEVFPSGFPHFFLFFFGLFGG